MLGEILGLLEVSKDSVANIQSEILSFQKKTPLNNNLKG
jgi:hypothetical protein